MAVCANLCGFAHERCDDDSNVRTSPSRRQRTSEAGRPRLNKYEALRALDLDETANEQDVRLAYYGIDKAISSQSFEDEGKVTTLVDTFKAYSLDARDFLLANGVDADGNDGMVDRVFRRKVKTEKLKVSAADDAWARLSGFDLLRGRLLSMRENELSKIRSCIVALVLCVVVSFITIRFLRATPRFVVEGVLLAIIIFASVVLTDAQKWSKIVKAHVTDIDDRAHALKEKLGIDDPDYVPPEQRVEGNAFTRFWGRVCAAFSRLAAKVRERRRRRGEARGADGASRGKRTAIAKAKGSGAGHEDITGATRAGAVADGKEDSDERQ